MNAPRCHEWRQELTHGGPDWLRCVVCDRDWVPACEAEPAQCLRVTVESILPSRLEREISA